jgi:hypothetical protein
MKKKSHEMTVAYEHEKRNIERKKDERRWSKRR